MARRRALWDQPYSFSVFDRRSTFGTSTGIGTSLTVFLFSVFRRSIFGTSTDRHWDQPYSFSVFLEVEGALLARRRALWDQPYSFSVFDRRSTFGTSTGIGTSLTVFLFSVFRRSIFGTSTDRHWDQPYSFSVFLEVEGALLARRRTLGQSKWVKNNPWRNILQGPLPHYVGRRMPTVPLFVFRRSGFGTLTGQNNLRGNISNGPPLYVDGPFGTSTGGIPHTYQQVRYQRSLSQAHQHIRQTSPVDQIRVDLNDDLVRR